MDLENFVIGLANLKSKFPQIENHGLDDGERLAGIIDHLPPLVLFDLYGVLNRVPNWQDTPQNLASLFDEIADPDAFSAEPLGASPAVAASFGRLSARDASFGEANFGSPSSKLDIFCSKGKHLRADPVRLQRVRAGWTWVSNMLDGVSEFSDAEWVIELAGEGSSIPTLIKGTMKTIGKVIESIFASVDAHRANLGLCRQIETDVAQHANLVDYRDAKGVTSAYWVVYGILQSRQTENPDLNERAATASLNSAGHFFGEGNYREAYDHIVHAYARLN